MAWNEQRVRAWAREHRLPARVQTLAAEIARVGLASIDDAWLQQHGVVLPAARNNFLLAAVAALGARPPKQVRFGPRDEVEVERWLWPGQRTWVDLFQPKEQRWMQAWRDATRAARVSRWATTPSVGTWLVAVPPVPWSREVLEDFLYVPVPEAEPSGAIAELPWWVQCLASCWGLR